jgi:hypothetical protein
VDFEQVLVERREALSDQRERIVGVILQEQRGIGEGLADRHAGRGPLVAQRPLDDDDIVPERHHVRTIALSLALVAGMAAAHAAETGKTPAQLNLGDTTIVNPTAYWISHAIDAMESGDAEFGILTISDDDTTYMQTAVEKDVPPPRHITVEYQEGSVDKHFWCNHLDKEQVASMLVAYLNGDERWRSACAWQKEEMK